MPVIDSTDLGAERELVRALVEVLDDDEKTLLVGTWALPGFFPAGRLAKLGLVLESGKISKLGAAVAREVLGYPRDPEDEEPSPELVGSIVGALEDDEKTAVLILSACVGLPTADLSGRLRGLRLILENGTISNLGRAVAKELLLDDPEASKELKAEPRKAD